MDTTLRSKYEVIECSIHEIDETLKTIEYSHYLQQGAKVVSILQYNRYGRFGEEPAVKIIIERFSWG